MLTRLGWCISVALRIQVPSCCIETSHRRLDAAETEFHRVALAESERGGGVPGSGCRPATVRNHESAFRLGSFDRDWLLALQRDGSCIRVQGKILGARPL